MPLLAPAERVVPKASVVSPNVLVSARLELARQARVRPAADPEVVPVRWLDVANALVGAMSRSSDAAGSSSIPEGAESADGVVDSEPAADPAVTEAAEPAPLMSSPESVPLLDAPSVPDAVLVADGEASAATPPPTAAPSGGAAVGEDTRGAAVPDEAPESTRAPVELIMPPAPTKPSAEQAERIGGVRAGGRRAAASAQDMPDATQAADTARGAVNEPLAETKAKAEQRLVTALGERPEPSPTILKLCDDIRTAIRLRRPVDEDDLLTAKPQQAAKEAGGTLSGSIQADGARVESSYTQLQQSPTGVSPPAAPNLLTPQRTARLGDPAAAAGAPDPIPAENLSLDADRAASQAKIDESRILRPSSEPILQPPFSDVREGQAELAEVAAKGPAEVAAEQQTAIDSAGADMTGLQLKALDALAASRAGGAAKVGKRQGDMVTGETNTRATVSARAQEIFAGTQLLVREQLKGLTATAMARWDAGLARLSTKFDVDLAEVQAKVDKRHSGVKGAIVGLWDAATGLPGWVTKAYDRAEKTFGDGVCELLVAISRDVNAVIATAQALVEDGRRQIDELFDGLDGDLVEWAAAEKTKFGQQLDSLSAEVQTARSTFEQGISERAVTAVNDVHAKVEALREKAKGLLGRIADAIQAFIDDPVKAIIDGLLTIVGIAPAAFWALVDKISQVVGQIADDPITFVNNLVAALGQGFSKFFDNFSTHLLGGFWKWLFSALGPVGVQVPTDFSPTGILTFILQVLGVSWAKVRQLLVKRLGPKAIDVLEKVWEFADAFITKGWEGIKDLLAPMIDPAMIIAMVVDMAVDYVVETLIKQVAVRVLGMLNPAGAVVQAIELIYKVLKWVFQNASKIFSLVETVVNGIADVLSGNLTGMATAIEKALAGLIPIVIAFLADLLGLGDLPQKVLEAVKKLQTWVETLLDRVIGWLIEQGKALLAKLGLGDKDGTKKPEGKDTEVGEHVRFSADGEAHTIWVDVNSGVPTVMMASSPTPLKDKIDKLEKEGLSRWQKHPKQRQDFEALIARARVLYVKTAADSESALRAFEATKSQQDPANARAWDTKAEQDERDLADVLKEILVKLGHGDPDLEILMADIASALPGHARRFTGEAEAFWVGKGVRGHEVTVTAKKHQPFAKTDLKAAHDAAQTTAASPATVQAVLKYFRSQATRNRDAETADFYSWAFSTKRKQLGPKAGVVRSTVLDVFGKTAAGLFRSDALTFLQTIPAGSADRQVLDEDFQTLPAFRPSSLFGAIELPKPGSLHGRFAMDPSYKKSTGFDKTTRELTLFYKTIEGEAFDVKVAVDLKETEQRLHHVIKGTGLSYHRLGRGKVEDIKGVGPGLGRDRAHLIADEFRGSGFADALNTLTTSADYNRKTMRAKELEITKDIDARAGANGDPYLLKFNLTVDVTFEEYNPGSTKGKVIDANFIKQIEDNEALNSPNKPRNVIMKAVRDSLVNSLRRVHGVKYTWQVFDAQGKALGAKKCAQIGPDRGL